MKHAHLVSLIVGAIVGLSPSLKADPLLIQETEGLYNSLSVKDSARPTLVLRLADLTFNESLSLQKASGNSAAEIKQIEGYRNKSIQWYLAALSGLDGLFSKPNSELSWKIKFQLGRLYADDGRTVEATSIWKELVAQDNNKTLKREAALRLAEAYEANASTVGIQDAMKYYEQALALCDGGDVCSYIHYRKAWILHRQDKHEPAIAEMKLALYDSKKQVREESLRDLITFLAAKPGDGKEELVYIQELEQQLQRPMTLSKDLGEGYFAQGNKPAGVFVVEQLNKRSPELKSHMRLLEEYYGFRQWDKFRNQLEVSAQFVHAKFPTGLNVKDDAEAERILRRLTVQLDGERVSQPQLSEDFKSSVLFYLSAFPSSGERAKMIDGWLAAETDSEKKMERLRTWVTEAHATANVSEEIRLREFRAALAQKSGNQAVVAQEMGVLKGLVLKESRKRECAYQEAHAYYLMKDFDRGLIGFRELARPAAGGVDSWAIQSQNLALDILGQQKKYDQLVLQIDSWLDNANVKAFSTNNPQLKKELGDMARVRTEARFEIAAQQGVTPVALKTFLQMCLGREFLPKSCQNAKILAVQLKDSENLISVLKVTDDHQALASELELIGEFGQAAAIHEKNLKPQSELRDVLRVALLYELSDQTADRDRVLKGLAGRLRTAKTMGREEALVFETLKDADLLDATSLKLPWTASNKLRVADHLEASNRGTTETKKMLSGTCEYVGTTWVQIADGELARLDSSQRAITFYGGQSQKKFKQRLAGLKALETRSDCYVKNAPANVRVPMLERVYQAYNDLAEIIIKTPLPDGVPADAEAQLRTSLEKMASPFQEKASAYQRLAVEQKAKVQNLSGPATTTPIAEAKPESALLVQARQELRKNPENQATIEKLKKYYGAIGKDRLAAYFAGRLLQSKKEAQ